MGYYKDRFTAWGTCAEHIEDVRLAKRDRDADDGRFRPNKVASTAVPPFCKAQMIDAGGFDWGSALIAKRWQYEQYRTDNPTWRFFDFQDESE